MSNSKSKIILAFFLFVFIIGSWLRFSGIFSNSFAFTYDVGRDLLEVHKIVFEHNITLIGQTTGLPGLFYGPWWYYLLSIPFYISSGNPQFVAAFMAFIGMLTVIFAFYFGKKISDLYTGLMFSALVSFSPYFIGLSSQIWNPNISQLLLVILFILVFNITNYNYAKIKFEFILMGLLLGLLQDAEIVFGILTSFGFLFSLLIVKRNILNTKNFLYLLSGFMITQIPRIVFEIRHNFIQLKNILNSDISNESGFAIPSSDTLIERVRVFISMFADSITNGNIIAALLIIAMFILIYFFIYKKISKAKMILLKTCFIMVATYFLGLLFLARPAWGHYLIGLPMFYLLILVIIISSMRVNRLGNYISILIFIFIALINLQPLRQISDLRQPLWEGNAAVYRNQLKVIDYIYQEAGNREFNYITYTPAVHDYPYQYLFKWYGLKSYGYVPSVNKASLFFIIIEPELDHPERLAGWLGIRKDDGKVIKVEKVRGGVVVQSRLH